MIYLIWSLPITAVAVLLVSGRIGSIGAGASGMMLALIVAVAAGPARFGARDAALAVLHGAWLAWLVGAILLGGLFFQELVSPDASAATIETGRAELSRRRLFTACFLIGPFAESATGFGVGQVATVEVLRRLRLTPANIILLGLFSQMMVPWGAMAAATIVGAHLTGLSPTTLGIESALLTGPLLIGWLLLFWRIAAIAGIPARRDLAGEFVWTLAAASLLVFTNAAFGPEIAALSALGPLIAAKFLLDERPDRNRCLAAWRTARPYAALICGLALTHAVPVLNTGLAELATVRPFADGPPWLLLLHPGSWLAAVGCATAALSGRLSGIPHALRHAEAKGRRPVSIILLFFIMAQVMASSGIAAELARGLRLELGLGAILSIPLFAGLFGFLTSSSNIANGILMPPQAALAAASEVSLPWLATIQNVSAAALTMLSPARLSMGCALVGRPELERRLYARAWPLGAVALAILVAAAGVLVSSRG